MENNTISVLKGFLWEEENTTINELMVEGAKDYFAMVRHMSNDYITKQQIQEGINSGEYDEFPQQSSVLDKIEKFSELSGIEYDEVMGALELVKGEIQAHLLEKVGEIAKEANEHMED
jgi:hypothetical protein